MSDQTLCVHHPAVPLDGFASLAVPTYRASTIPFVSASAYSARGELGSDGYAYGLAGTPTTRVLEAQITSLHQGHRTVLTSSGQAAIALVMAATLAPGNRVLIPDTVYPPVRRLCFSYLKPLGIDYTVYDPLSLVDISNLIDQRTKLVWLESPGSATMEIQDIPSIVAMAHAKGALVGCDNTWATPLLFKPLLHGVDFAVEALTKYVGGHSDLLLGSITAKDEALSKRLLEINSVLGLGVSPDECSLALRGIETMALRVAHVGAVSTRLAETVHSRFPHIDVLHPALPHCQGHAIWKRDFLGSSGVFSIALGKLTPDRLETAFSKLKTFAIGASWGGTRSIVVPMTVDMYRQFGRYVDGCTILRLSIGLEDESELQSELLGLVSDLAE